MTRMNRRCEDVRVRWSLARARMRARILAMRGARLGSKVTVAEGCSVDRPWCVELGHRAQLEHGVYLKVVDDAATLKLGDHVFVGRGVEFDVMADVTVGHHTVIAPHCFITDHDHGVSPGLRIDQQPCTAAAVSIGADVWLGAGVVVLSGVKIGDGAVIGAGSVVTRDVAPMTIVAGAPARFLRSR